MKQLINKIFLNDKFILCVILLNSCIIYLQVAGHQGTLISVVDVTCTLIFLIEMLVKHIHLGVRRYWREGWNRLDGTLALLSIPSIIELFIPNGYASLSILMIFRLLRVLRFFHVLHFFPNFSKLIKAE